MASKSMVEEYAELMKHNGDGHYLYTPQRFRQLHPGSIGYFDKYGNWNEITDVSVPGRPEEKGFIGIDRELRREEPTERLWKTVSSGSEAEASFGLTGGLSGALTAAPVDVSANAKNKATSNGKAALITTSLIKNERFVGGVGPSIAAWVKKNAKALVKSEYGDDIKQYGLWAIHTTWSAPPGAECAITMTSGHSRDTRAGVDVGGTGVGKIGANGSSLKKLESEGWRVHKATESDQGLVVSFGGAGFKLHSIQAFRSNPLKQIERCTGDYMIWYAKQVLDESGNVIGFEEYRPVYDENGKKIGEEEIDEETEKKKREEEAAEVEEDFEIECEPVGLSESDLAADKKAEEEQRKEFSRKVAEICKNPDHDEGHKCAELDKLLAANTTTATTITYA